jgi:hypothetical protein
VSATPLNVHGICAQIDEVARMAFTLIDKVRGDRDALRDALKAVLACDAAGRPFPQLLREAAMVFDQVGGGPLGDCLRLKAESIEAAIWELQL